MTQASEDPPKFASLSVFFPAYNDAQALPGLIDSAFAVLRRNVEDFEVIVVNDGSLDGTAELLPRLQANYGPELRVVTHEKNRGYGAALQSGFAAATRDFVFYTDGDGQYDVRELPRLLAACGPNVGLVNGYKLERRDPRRRVWIGRLYNAFSRALFRIRIRDIDCDYRLIRRSVVNRLELSSSSGTICIELAGKIELSGCGVAEVGVHHFPRRHGRSEFFRPGPLFRTFLQLPALYGRIVIAPAFARWSRPLTGWWRAAWDGARRGQL
jgi:glycosyltransferase involved in cell wall biosynthesis